MDTLSKLKAQRSKLAESLTQMGQGSIWLLVIMSAITGFAMHDFWLGLLVFVIGMFIGLQVEYHASQSQHQLLDLVIMGMEYRHTKDE